LAKSSCSESRKASGRSMEWVNDVVRDLCDFMNSWTICSIGFDGMGELLVSGNGNMEDIIKELERKLGDKEKELDIVKVEKESYKKELEHMKKEKIRKKGIRNEGRVLKIKENIAMFGNS